MSDSFDSRKPPERLSSTLRYGELGDEDLCQDQDPASAGSPVPVAEEPIPLGETLDSKYTLEKVLGQGSTGVVYLADDIALERKVAIKVLLPIFAADPKLAKGFHREAVAMARVRHNNVVQIYAFGAHQGLPYFVMEHIQGHTVASYLERSSAAGHPLYLDVALGILSQVCHGLQAVHDNRIVHRDVKPANMLIGPVFRVAIADFGLVEQMDQASSSQDLAGTPMYLAPELLKSATIPDDQRHLADIYALGVSTYEMLTGEGPFHGNNITEVLRCHLKEPPPRVTDLRSDLTSTLNDVLARAMHKDPTQRFQSCMEFLKALNQARGSKDIEQLGASWKILVVDSDPEEYQSYTTALKIGIPGSTLLTAEDGLEALEVVKEERPDMVLVDLEIKGLNGLEFCASLRGDDDTSDIPLIVIGEQSREKELSLLSTMGVHAVMTKPVELIRLVNLAQHCLEG